MKKILGYSFLVVILILGGCKKLVDEQPLSDGTLQDFFKSKYDVYAAVAGMYGGFQQAMIGESQFNNRVTWWGDSRSDNLANSTPNSESNEVFYNTLTPNNKFSDWTPLYTVIGRANLVLGKINEVNTRAVAAEKITDAEIKSYSAQCYAMRAMCYLWILKVWGDASIRTTPFLDLNDNPLPPRDSKVKVKEQIIADLQAAYDLTVKNATPSVWYINEGAICAMMADVYMWKSHDNQIMPDYANAIIWFKNLFKAKAPTGKVYTGTTTAGTNGLSPDLVPTAEWKTIFTNPAANIETIWTLHWDVNSNGCPCMMAVSSTVNNTPMKTSSAFYTGSTSWVRAGLDIRAKQTIDSSKSDNFDRINKWYGPSGYVNAKATYMTRAQSDAAVGTDKPVYFPMYRLADMFLLYAEALNKTGDAVNAVKYLNFVHQRATLPAFVIGTGAGQISTQQQIEDAILQERQWELFDEGKRWFDLCRTDHVIQVMDPILKTRQLAAGAAQIGFGTDVRRYLWPLNRNVLNANPNLKQNPPYSD